MIYRRYSGIATFAHEAGHYLGLAHVFEEDWCDDTPQYDRAQYLTEQYIPGINTYSRYPIDASAEPYTALNVMDYDIVIYSGITPPTGRAGALHLAACLSRSRWQAFTRQHEKLCRSGTKSHILNTDYSMKYRKM